MCEKVMVMAWRRNVIWNNRKMKNESNNEWRNEDEPNEKNNEILEE